jgi:beta-N-acetylhexosaminidase
MQLSPDPRARRRLAALAVAAGVALIAGLAIGAGGGDEPSRGPASRSATAPDQAPAAAKAPAPKLTLRQLAGQAVMLRFHGTKAPAYVKRALRRRRVAGVILFRDNAPSAASVKALNRSLQRAAGGRALISVDQEGGPIRILPWAEPTPGQSGQGPPAQVAAAARAAARDLREVGVNVNLAPVADMGGPGPVMRGRAFAGGVADVAAATAAAVRAYRGSGVAATLKHFPGIGAAARNTDDAAVTIERPASEIGAADLPPFKAGIDAGAPLVMVGHAVYPALDPDAVASQSRAVVTDLLRGELGFRGVAITDSIEAQAVRGRMGPAEAAVASVRAGIDLVLTTGRGSYLPALNALEAEARRDSAFRARLRQAAARVLALQASLGK